jgi:hypothetical protein
MTTCAHCNLPIAPEAERALVHDVREAVHASGCLAKCTTCHYCGDIAATDDYMDHGAWETIQGEAYCGSCATDRHREILIEQDEEIESHE